MHGMTVTHERAAMNQAFLNLPAGAEPEKTRAADSRREAWRRQRHRMEAGKEKHTPSGITTRRRWETFKFLLGIFDLGLRVLGLFERGVRNALDIRLKRIELEEKKSTARSRTLRRRVAD